ncbi:hypothetical protein FQR65_LT07701 [Abscondita terminalis]|nr:hypothetical protein FQR65_LT07701 [Abscondita terminalis]
MFQIEGKVALITGGASGIGLHYAIQLLKNGLKGVTLADINEELGKKALGDLGEQFGHDKVIFVKVDVTEKTQFEDAFKKTLVKFKNIDILINNAGILDDTKWEKEIDINIKGTVIGTLLAIQNYICNYKTGEEGVIVNISSIVGIHPTGLMPVYSATKHAIIGLTRSFATKLHYEISGVRIFAVCPGPTDTPLMNDMEAKCLRADYSEHFKEIKQSIVQQPPEDVARYVVDLIRTASLGSIWVVHNGEKPHEMFEIEGKIALITGGASGLGFLYATELLKKGVKGVTLADVNDELGQKSLKILGDEFGHDKVLFVKLDVVNKEQFEDAFKKTVEKYKNVDILINNAGIMDELNWEKSVDINLKGTINGTLLAIQNYISKHKSGQEGVVVNISSLAGIRGASPIPIYSATKYGIIGLTHSFGTEMHYTISGVRIFAVCPGFTDTSMTQNYKDKVMKEEYLSGFLAARGPLKFQNPEHVARHAVDLIKTASHGSVWIIDANKEPFEYFTRYSMFELEEKVCLVTGGLSGIGLACVKELLKNGVKGVSIIDLNAHAGSNLVSEIRKEFGENKSIFIKADVSDTDQFEGAFKKTVAHFGNIDVLINNAGIYNEKQWKTMVNVNLNGFINGNLLGLEEYIPKHKSGPEGVIVNVSSLAGINVRGNHPIYTATKFGVVGLSRSFGKKDHYDRTKIKVITVCPGMTDTSMIPMMEENAINEHYVNMFRQEKEHLIMQPTCHVSKTVKPDRFGLLRKMKKLDATCFQLAGKVSLITGGVSGIGLACVKELLKNGVKGVGVVDINEQTGSKVLENIREEFGENKAIFIKADVSDKNQFEDAFKKIVSQYGNIDVLINNAAVYDEKKWERMVSVNLNGFINGNLLGLEEYIPKYKSGPEGVVVNICSIASISARGNHPIYTATKFGTLGLSRSLGISDHYNRTKVKVVSVCPGITDTGMVPLLETNAVNEHYANVFLKVKPNLKLQTSSHVGKTVVDVIKNGKAGSAWYVEGDKEAYELEFPTKEELRKM